MSELSELAERIEQASGPDQFKYLVEAWEAINGDRQSALQLPLAQLESWNYARRWFLHLLEAWGFVDAAMSLVPEGWPSMRVGTTDDGRGYAELAGNDMHMVAEDPDEFYVETEAATPALALTAASLRARSGEKE